MIYLWALCMLCLFLGYLCDLVDFVNTNFIGTALGFNQLFQIHTNPPQNGPNKENSENRGNNRITKSCFSD